MSDEQAIEMRGLVLELAAVHANQVVEIVRATALDFGRVHENVDVGGIMWHICVRYWQEDDTVKIDATPVPDQQLPPMIVQLFGGGENVNTAGAVEFSLPAAWLPQLVDEQ